MKSKVTNIINKLDNWFINQEYKGYDIYDLYDNFIFHKLLSIRFKIIRKLFRRIISYIIHISPKFIIKIFNKKPNYNSKALALTIKGYCNLYSSTSNTKYLIKAENLSNLLISLSNSSYSGNSWGYPFNWSSSNFIPANTPSSVVTCFAGDAFFSLYEITSNKLYIDICSEICRFLIEELNIDEISEDSICFSYTPLDNYHVHNANLFVAEFLIRMGIFSNNSKFVALGKRALNYSLSEQNENGSLFYWGNADRRKILYNFVNNDHYHTGFEIRALLRIQNIFPFETLSIKLNKYYKYYYENYVNHVNKFIYYRPKSTYPINIHACSEFIILNSSFVKPKTIESIKYLEICDHLIDKMIDIDSLFIYEINKFFFFEYKVKYKFFRWSQAWMFLALTELLKFLDEENGENNNI